MIFVDLCVLLFDDINTDVVVGLEIHPFCINKIVLYRYTLSI